MFGIDILYTEHDNIVRFTGYLRRLCGRMLGGETPNKGEWMDCVNFIREYADEHHHGKEEAILFRLMLQKLGPMADRMINSGMMVEHNLGRYHLQGLEEAVTALSENPTEEEMLDVITHALSYADLLRRHATKENNVLFPFAAKNLSPEDLETVNRESAAYEEEGNKKGMGRYVEWLDQVCP